MADSEKKKLSELRVKDLRLELGTRGLDKTGTKPVLMKRLEEALEEEGKDPETFIFGEDENDLQEDAPGSGEEEAAENLHEDENADEENLIDEDKLLADDDEDNPEEHVEEEEHEEANELLEEEEQDPTKKEKQEYVQNEVEESQKNVEHDNMVEANSVEKTEDNGPQLSKDLTSEKQNVVDNDVSIKTVYILEKEKEENSSEKMEQANKECSQPALIDEPNIIKKPTTKEDQTNEPKDNQEDEEENKKKTKDNKNIPKRKEQSANPTVIWISNISRTTRASELKAALHKCGKVISAKVVLNAKYPGSNCFGYVTMATIEAVQMAIDTLNNTELNGRMIQVHKFDEVRLDQQRKMVGNKPEKKDAQCPVKPTEKKDKVLTKPDEKSNDTEVKAPQPTKVKGRGGPSKFPRAQQHQPNLGFKNKAYPPKKVNPHYRENRSAFLNFEKIKEVRKEQQLIRDERVHRERIKKLDAERNRQKEIDERARRERRLIEKEKEELRIEKEKLEREKQRLRKLEQEQIQRDLIKKEAQALKQTINIIEEIPNRKRPRSPRRYPKEPTHFEPPRYNNGADSPERRRPKFEPPYQGRGRDSSPPRGRMQDRERFSRPEERKSFDPRNKDRYQSEFRPPPKRFEHGPRRDSPPQRREYGHSDDSRSSERGDWRKQGDSQSYTSRDPRSYNPVYNREANSKPNNTWNPYGQIRYSPPASWSFMQPLAQAMAQLQNQGYQQSMNPMGMSTPPAPSIGSYNNYGGPLRRY